MNLFKSWLIITNHMKQVTKTFATSTPMQDFLSQNIKIFTEHPIDKNRLHIKTFLVNHLMFKACFVYAPNMSH